MKQLVANIDGAQWRHIKVAGGEAYIAGTFNCLKAFAASCRRNDTTEIQKALLDQHGHFGIVLVFEDMCFVACDRVQSYPLLYETKADGSVIIATDAKMFRNSAYKDSYQADLAPFYLLAGYTAGKHTLIRNVFRVLPGELIYFKEKDGDPPKRFQQRYFAYMPDLESPSDEDSLLKGLEERLDEVTEHLMRQADGRTICLALSAGLDSRVILAKLVEHGYPNIRTFSYGTWKNMEAREARKIASKLNVKWEFIGPRRADINDFHFGDGNEFNRSASGITTTAVFTEFYALKQLQNRGITGDEFLFVNGQTGDFLTGGHLRPHTGFAMAVEWIKSKHFSLFARESLGIAEDQIDRYLSNWIKENCGSAAFKGLHAGDSFNLMLEWQERQSNYIINSMRAYDWHGQKWALPLWHPRLIDFYMGVPHRLQLSQQLYFEFLSAWNFSDLFRVLRKPYDPWCWHGQIMRGMGGLIGQLIDNKAKDSFYRRNYYYSDLWYLYRLFGRRAYLDLHECIRSPASLFTIRSLQLLKMDLGLAERLDIQLVNKGSIH